MAGRKLNFLQFSHISHCQAQPYSTGKGDQTYFPLICVKYTFIKSTFDNKVANIANIIYCNLSQIKTCSCD